MMKRKEHPVTQKYFQWFLAAICPFAVGIRPALAQSVSSGSTGADGPLNLTTPGTIAFDPKTFNPPLDPDGDNVYHFTTINIGVGVTVKLSSKILNGPVHWLAQGPVTIGG